MYTLSSSFLNRSHSVSSYGSYYGNSRPNIQSGSSWGANTAASWGDNTVSWGGSRWGANTSAWNQTPWGANSSCWGGNSAPWGGYNEQQFGSLFHKLTSKIFC